MFHEIDENFTRLLVPPAVIVKSLHRQKGYTWNQIRFRQYSSPIVEPTEHVWTPT